MFMHTRGWLENDVMFIWWLIPAFLFWANVYGGIKAMVYDFFLHNQKKFLCFATCLSNMLLNAHWWSHSGYFYWKDEDIPG